MKSTPKPCVLSDYALDLVRCKTMQLIGKAGYTPNDIDDIQQDLIVDLLERLPKFDPAKASYNTFVARVVERKISNLLRDRQAERRDHRREVCSLNDDVDQGDGDETVQRGATISQDEQDLRRGKYRRSAEARNDLRLDIQQVLADLPPELRRAAELMQTMPVAQVARAMGIPHATFYDNHLKRLRHAFTAKGLADHLG